MTALLTPLVGGAEAVLLDRFSPAAAAERIEERKITIFPAVPTMLVQMVGEGVLKPGTVASLRNITAGGSALSDQIYSQVYESCGKHVLQGYGLSENSPVVSVNRSTESHRLGSVGTPLDSVEVGIYENGGLVGPGELGEVVLRGPSVMAEYWGDPEWTDRTLKDGWLHTRDLGMLDEDGFLWLRGHQLPMIICGGFNVYPAEVEQRLQTHPGVRRAWVEGHRDPIHGELPIARVQKEEGSELTLAELSSWCRRQLSAYKIPRHFSWVAGFAEQGTIDG